jgi:hypothetical protein
MEYVPLNQFNLQILYEYLKDNLISQFHQKILLHALNSKIKRFFTYL